MDPSFNLIMRDSDTVKFRKNVVLRQINLHCLDHMPLSYLVLSFGSYVTVL